MEVTRATTIQEVKANISYLTCVSNYEVLTYFQITKTSEVYDKIGYDKNTSFIRLENLQFTVGKKSKSEVNTIKI